LTLGNGCQVATILRLAPCGLRPERQSPRRLRTWGKGKTAHYPKGQGISLTLDDPCTDAGDDDKSAQEY